MNANSNEKIFCFHIKTVNNETFIFGSTKKNEINDWIQELNNYQQLYETKMNEILVNCSVIKPKKQQIN